MAIHLEPMKTDEKTFLEITEGNSKVKIELIKVLNQNSDFDWDKNYIPTLISYTDEIFHGQFKTKFMTIDFEKFKRDLINVYKGLNDEALFECLEHDLKLIIKRRGAGLFSLLFMENETVETHKLNLILEHSQTLDLIRQLEKLTEKFPIIGNEFRIKNSSYYSENIPSEKKNSELIKPATRLSLV